MPAYKKKVDNENTYYYLYNKGREDKLLFKDTEDFNTFIGYLNEYLTPPSDTPTKKVFTVQGKTFHGVPHLPKNYHQRVELVAYSLIPSSFSLLVKQVERGSLQSFVRSLSTRYSIYFNKKYQRSGQLFDGACKSRHLENSDEVTLLTYYLHKKEGYSSINKYLHAKLPYMVASRSDISSYDEFIKKYEPTKEESDKIQSLVFDSKPELKESIPHSLKIDQNNAKYLKTHQRAPELALASVLFLTLLSFGLKNVTAQTQTNNIAVLNENVVVEETNKPEVAGISTEAINEVDKTVTGSVQVVSNDPFVPVSIYNDIYKTSEILKAADGAVLKTVNAYGNWTEVKLDSTTYGFIETIYVKKVEEQKIETATP